jgi:hypothetical protein
MTRFGPAVCSNPLLEAHSYNEMAISRLYASAVRVLGLSQRCQGRKLVLIRSWRAILSCLILVPFPTKAIGR